PAGEKARAPRVGARREEGAALGKEVGEHGLANPIWIVRDRRLHPTTSHLARAGLVTGYDHTCRRCKAKGTPDVERHADASLRHSPRCHMKLWPRPLKSKMRFHDLRHTAATLMLRARVDPHRVQRVLRHASVTTTTGTYAHLAIEDLRDAVSKIGPQPLEPSPFADRLRTSVATAPAVNEDTCPKVPENAALGGAPGRSRT